MQYLTRAGRDLGVTLSLTEIDEKQIQFDYSVDSLTPGRFVIEKRSNGSRFCVNLAPIIKVPEDELVKARILEWCAQESTRLLGGHFVVAEGSLFLQKGRLIFEEGVGVNSIKDSFMMIIELASFYRKHLAKEYGCEPLIQVREAQDN